MKEAALEAEKAIREGRSEDLPEVLELLGREFDTLRRALESDTGD